MKNLFLEAQDVWLFRDGRPFDAGSAHRAESLFPAHPFTIQGAIRSHQLVLKKVDLNDRDAVKKEVGEPLTFPGAQSMRGLTLSGTFVARRTSKTEVERLFPLPADAYWNTAESVRAATLDGRQLLPGADAKKPRGMRWLTQADLIEYFAGKPVQGIPQEDVFARENRFGIGRNAAWVTEQGLLYEVEFICPRAGVGLLVHMDGYEDPGWENGLLQLGGEGRAALYSQVKVNCPPPDPRASLPICLDSPKGFDGTCWSKPPNPLPARFKIYLTTPCYFKGGSQPTNWGQFFTGEVNLLATAIRGYETMGGFDWVKDPESHQAHRASRRYVPAGSVYYFENKQDAKLITDSLTEYGAEIGFGRFIVSPVKEK